jgi:hypothetical protein
MNTGMARCTTYLNNATISKIGLETVVTIYGKVDGVPLCVFT